MGDAATTRSGQNYAECSSAESLRDDIVHDRFSRHSGGNAEMKHSARLGSGTSATSSAVQRCSVPNDAPYGDDHDGGATVKVALTRKLIKQYGLAAPFIVYSLNKAGAIVNLTKGTRRRGETRSNGYSRHFKEAKFTVNRSGGE
jgi:hypothetical protein